MRGAPRCSSSSAAAKASRHPRRVRFVSRQRDGGPTGLGAGGGGGGWRTRRRGATLAGAIFAQADTNEDQKLTRAELIAARRQWFDKLDTRRPAGSAQADFATGSPASCRNRRPARPRQRRGEGRAGAAGRPAALAGVEQDHRRLLQVPLARSAGDHRTRSTIRRAR